MQGGYRKIITYAVFSCPYTDWNRNFFVGNKKYWSIAAAALALSVACDAHDAATEKALLLIYQRVCSSILSVLDQLQNASLIGQSVVVVTCCLS